MISRLTAPARRPFWIAVAAGPCAALALPDWSIWPLGFLGMGALFWATLNAPNARAAFWRGGGFGVGFFIVGLYWIGFSFGNRDPALAPLAPFAILALGFGLAVFPALACALARRCAFRGWSAPIGFAACWTLFEWIRGVAFTGFPWNLAAHAVPPGTPLSQAAAMVGVYGLSFLVVLIAASPASLLLNERRSAFGAIGLATALLAGMFGFGAMRGPAPMADADAPIVRIVQPNIAQRDKWDRAQRESHFANLLDLSSASRAGAKPKLVIWPETATPFDLANEALARRVIATRALEPGASAIIGTLRFAGDGQLRNSLIVLDDEGAMTATYDKHHLVPFGEYLPFEQWLPFGGLAGSGFEAGPGPQTLAASGFSFSPLICYEAIFPRHAVGSQENRPDFLLNVTNDAWFGDSPGPRQHLVAVAYRAIEQGLPLLRAANTGVSAVVDAHGETLLRKDLGARGALDAVMPPTVDAPPAAKFPFWINSLLLIALIFSAVAFARAR